MAPAQTALGRLLQERREAAGYSRVRVGELVGIKAGTIEGWELGRVARPPIHDVLRLSHFLRIPAEEIKQAVFEDAGEISASEEQPDRKERKKAGRRPRRGAAAVPLLESAFRLFGWADEEDAADALGTSADAVRGWRSGAEQMAFADYLTLTSMIGVAAAEAMKGDEARIADPRLRRRSSGSALPRAGSTAAHGAGPDPSRRGTSGSLAPGAASSAMSAQSVATGHRCEE